MKKMFLVFLLVTVASLVAVVPAFALQNDAPVSQEQIVLIGAVATAVTFGLRVLFAYGNFKLSRASVNILLSVVSGVLAFTWAGLTFPPLSGDVWVWLNNLFLLVMPVLGTASFIYNLLYNKVVLPLEARLLP